MRGPRGTKGPYGQIGDGLPGPPGDNGPQSVAGEGNVIIGKPGAKGMPGDDGSKGTAAYAFLGRPGTFNCCIKQLRPYVI